MITKISHGDPIRFDFHGLELSVFTKQPRVILGNQQEDAMNATTTEPFAELQKGINEATAELDKLVQYCSDTRTTAPGGALRTVEDLEGMIREAADLVRAHVTIFKRKTSKARQ